MKVFFDKLLGKIRDGDAVSIGGKEIDTTNLGDGSIMVYSSAAGTFGFSDNGAVNIDCGTITGAGNAVIDFGGI